MKNAIKLLAFSLFVSFTACSDDEETNCGQMFTGPDCKEQITPTGIKITGITVYNLPIANRGNPWDNGFGAEANPDLYLEVNNGFTTFANNRLLILNNASTFGRHTIQLPVEPLLNNVDFSNQVLFDLYDFDDNGLEIMSSAGSILYNTTNAFPAEILLTGSQGVKFEIQLEYVF